MSCQFHHGDSRVGAVEVAVGAHGRMALGQLAAFVGVGGESLAWNDQRGFAFLDPEPKRFANGGSKLAALPAAAPAVNDLEQEHAAGAGRLHLGQQAASSVIDGGMAGFEVESVQHRRAESGVSEGSFAGTTDQCERKLGSTRANRFRRWSLTA